MSLKTLLFSLTATSILAASCQNEVKEKPAAKALEQEVAVETPPEIKPKRDTVKVYNVQSLKSLHKLIQDAGETYDVKPKNLRPTFMHLGFPREMLLQGIGMEEKRKPIPKDSIQKHFLAYFIHQKDTIGTSLAGDAIVGMMADGDKLEKLYKKQKDFSDCHLDIYNIDNKGVRTLIQKTTAFKVDP